MFDLLLASRAGRKSGAMHNIESDQQLTRLLNYLTIVPVFERFASNGSP